MGGRVPIPKHHSEQRSYGELVSCRVIHLCTLQHNVSTVVGITVTRTVSTKTSRSWERLSIKTIHLARLREPSTISLSAWLLGSLLLLRDHRNVHRNRRLIRDGSPGRPPPLSHSSWVLSSSLQCCFTSTETVRTVRDGEPRTATSTFTQLLSSESWTRPHTQLQQQTNNDQL